MGKAYHGHSLSKDRKSRKSGEGDGDCKLALRDSDIGDKADDGDQERNDIPEERHCEIEPF